MIIKVMAARGDPGQTIDYLLGPGHNEHLQAHQHRHSGQHVIAGVQAPGGLPGDALSAYLSDALRFNALNNGLRSSVKHVQHVVLSLSPEETASLTSSRSPESRQEQPGLTDAQWDALTADYLQQMGWAGVPFVAVRHGLSADGCDHVHLALTDVTENGRRLDTFRSGKRSQRVAPGLESRHGLQVLQSRLDGVSARDLTAGEKGMSRRTGQPAPREQLAGQMRAAATAAGSEAEYVRRLRTAGVDHRPRISGEGLVIGYSVRTADMPPGVWHQAGRVARDLSLPRLRAGWPQELADHQQAAAEWRGRAAPAVDPAGDLRAVTGALRRERHRPGHKVSPAELSGALAVAGRVTGDRQLSRAGLEVGRYAQTRRPDAASGRRGGSPLSAAVRALSSSLDPAQQEAVKALVMALELLLADHRYSVSAAARAAQGQTPLRAVDALVYSQSHGSRGVHRTVSAAHRR